MYLLAFLSQNVPVNPDRQRHLYLPVLSRLHVAPFLHLLHVTAVIQQYTTASSDSSQSYENQTQLGDLNPIIILVHRASAVQQRILIM